MEIGVIKNPSEKTEGFKLIWNFTGVIL